MRKILAGILVLLFYSCSKPVEPSVVTFEVKDGEAVLYVDGKRWNTRAVSGFDFLDMAQAAGVNTIRTWGWNNLDDGKLLDEAHKRGMKVLAGFWMAHQGQGIDYTSPSDSLKIKQQFDRVTEGVMRYKDHPAILAWGVANEINARNAPDQVWDAVNDVAEFIRENDPNHPTVTVLAGSQTRHIKNVMKLAPAIDILGINSYADTRHVRENIKAAGWKNPFMVTELGPDGFWESDTTLWGAPLEVNSSIAARMYTDRYKMVDADPLCIGVFPFKWGSVPKKTPTWLSVFLSDSCKTESYDALYYIWNDKYPANRAPELRNLVINGKISTEDHVFTGKEIINAKVEVLDYDGDEIHYRWEILPEIILTPGIQGTQKIQVSAPDDLIISEHGDSVSFTCPEQAGAYRLYVYAYDDYRSCAYANLPFLVQ